MLITLACKEDVVVEKIVNIPGDTVEVAPKLNYTSIASFSVDTPDDGTALKASVRGDSIYLYWPIYLQQPEHIVPVISVAQKATVQPASETEVAFETGVTYTVTAEDGTKKNYVLKVVINQPNPWFEAIAADVEVGTDLILIGDFFIPDMELTRVFLVPEDGGDEVQLVISSLQETHMVAAVPADLAVGPYTVRVQTGWRVAYDRAYEKLGVRYPSPLLNNPEGMAVHPGDTYALQGTNLRSITAARALSVADGLYYPLEIVIYDVTGITLKIPDNFPLGQYNAYQLESEWAPDGLYVRTLTTSRRLTVEASPD